MSENDTYAILKSNIATYVTNTNTCLSYILAYLEKIKGEPVYSKTKFSGMRHVLLACFLFFFECIVKALTFFSHFTLKCYLHISLFSFELR